MLCQDVLQIIMSYLPSIDQLNMHSSCKDFYELYITNVDAPNINDYILKQNKYLKIEILVIHNEIRITTIKHLKNLVKLYCPLYVNKNLRRYTAECSNLVDYC